MTGAPGVPDPQPVTLDGGDFSCTITVTDDHAVHITVRGDNTPDVSLTPAQLEALLSLGGAAQANAAHLEDLVRLRAHHPLGLSNAVASADDGPYTSRVIRTDAQWKTGEPGMEWDTNAQCWRLFVIGAETVTLGYAMWDDRAGITSLIEGLQDREGAHVMLGMLDPTEAARIASLEAAYALKRMGALPRVTHAPLRKMLTEAGLGSRNTRDTVYSGYARILNLPAESHAGHLPVAVALVAPMIPNTAVPPTTHPVQPRGRFRPVNPSDTWVVEAREAWADQARSVIERHGWRVVDLPNPKRPFWHRSSNAAVLWVTLLDERAWESVKRAATILAPYLDVEQNPTRF